MSQNLKIVLANVNKQTPNNVGFSDTITIKAGSKIALTSFNASFDINKQGQEILGQSFIMNLNEELYNLPRTITIPDKTYYNEVELKLEITKQLNKSFSAYEKDAPDPRVFTGYYLQLVESNLYAQDSGFGGSVVKDKTAIVLSSYQNVLMPLNLALDSEFSVNEDGELETENENLDFDHTYNRYTIDPETGDLATDNFLGRGGGVAFQYNMRFNLKNQTLTSNVKLADQNGDYMILHYNTTNRPVAGVDGRFAPSVRFYVEKSVNGVITYDDIEEDKFFHYNTFINVNYINPNMGAFGVTNATKNESYFLWCVRDGKWIILYYDYNAPAFHELYTNGINYKMEDNYTFSKHIKQPKTKQVIYYPEQTKGTLASTKFTGSATIKTSFNFQNANLLKEIFSFGNVSVMQPENTFPAQYTPNGPTDFYPPQNFELACEIDTIKIKNYVGTIGNTGAGRKNIIAYFTPSSTISQSSFIYSFDPSSPIYLAVDSKSDIDFNSMNIRFINTYSNRSFTADTITCVLTNSP